MKIAQKKIVFSLLLSLFLKSESLYSQNFGFQIGLTANFGTHVNALGLNFNLHYSQSFVQLNLGNQSKFNFTSYGKRKLFFENRFATGLILLAGKKNLNPDFLFDALLHNTNYQYALGYNYIWYLDNAQTSQRSGGWSLGLNYFTLLFENDVFGGQAKDRFRSGNLQLAYRYKNFNYFTQFYIWTGETKGSVWVKDSLPNCPNGYRSLADLPYGKTSHGILSFGINSFYDVNGNSAFRQQFSFKTGIDSEQIRHLFQNKITHDLIFLPKSIKRNTPHYPRLNSEGKPIFNKKERRKDKFFFQLSSNEIWSN